MNKNAFLAFNLVDGNAPKFSKKHGPTRARLLDRLLLHLKHVLEHGSVRGKTRLLLRAVTFTEKLFYKMPHDRRPRLTTFADKLLAREYATAGLVGRFWWTCWP